jgi:hypothetical protein
MARRPGMAMNHWPQLQAAGSSGVSRLAVTTRFRPLFFAW